MVGLWAFTETGAVGLSGAWMVINSHAMSLGPSVPAVSDTSVRKVYWPVGVPQGMVKLRESEAFTLRSA